MATSSISFPTEIYSGPGSFKNLSDIVSPMGNKALLVTSRKQFQDSNIIEEIQATLKANHLNVLLFDEVSTSSNSETVDQIASMAKSARCEFVIGLGGDIVLNTAKAVSLVASNPGDCSDYLTEQDGYRLNISNKPLPCIMIPSFYGTLCEANPGFVIREKSDGIFKKLYNTKIRPTATILDPQLMRSFSPKFLSASGLLILGYAIDSFISPESNALSEIYSLKAVELTSQYLHELVTDPDNEENRFYIMTASLMVSYSASCTGMGAIYSLCEAVASVSDIYKGTVAAILLPQLMEYNLTSASGRYVQLARMFGENVKEISVLEAAIKAVERVRMFVEEFHIPARLSEVGMDTEHIESIKKIYRRYEEHRNVPRELGSVELTAILEQSF